MEYINVIITNETGIVKDIHPLGNEPIKPHRVDFKNDDDFNKAINLYNPKIVEWYEIDKKLNRYKISSLRCASGITLKDMGILHWHVGNKLKVVLQEDGSVMEDGMK